MELLKRDKNEKRVRIIIGTNLFGQKSIVPPTKTITLKDTNVKEVYDLIIKILKEKVK